MSFIWLLSATIFIISEKVYKGGVLICFSISSFITFLISFLPLNTPLELLVFFSISLLLILLSLLLSHKKIKTHLLISKTSLELIGQKALVIKEIGTTKKETGLIKLDNEIWNAFSSSGTTIPSGSIVLVNSIKGIIVEVSPT